MIIGLLNCKKVGYLSCHLAMDELYELSSDVFGVLKLAPEQVNPQKLKKVII